MFKNIKLLLRLLRELGNISLALRSLEQTIIAQTILTTDKPMSYREVYKMREGKILSPLLHDLLSSRVGKVTFAEFSPEKVKAQSDKREYERLHQPWRDEIL